MPPITSASTPSSAIAAEPAEYALIKESDDLDREKRNERKNVQPNVFHSSYLLKFFRFRGGHQPIPSLTVA